MFERDVTSKWLIQDYGDTFLRLAGFRGITSWTPLQAEVAEPRRIPDGLIEVRRRGRRVPVLVVLEVSTYPYSRLARQAADDALLIYLARGRVPEVVALVLKPRSKRPTPSELVLRSEEGTTTIHVAWRVVELWKIAAEELLASGEIGLIPLVPLSRYDGPMGPILEECRERIRREAPAEEVQNFLVATHFFAGLKYNDPTLFLRLGGDKAMFKTGSPLLREIVEEETEKARRESQRDTLVDNIIAVLTARFGAEAKAVRPSLDDLGPRPLKNGLVLAATCPDLASFRDQIAARKRKRRG